MFFSQKSAEKTTTDQDASQHSAAQSIMEAHLSETLFSKMCHDLVNPLSATQNGLEVMTEDPDMGEEALGLVSESADILAGRLRLYRLAYGTAQGSTGLDHDALKDCVTNFFKGEHRLRITNVSPVTPSDHLPPEGKKLLFNMAVCAADALTHGGELEIQWTTQTITVTATAASPDRPVKENTCLLYDGSGYPGNEAITPYTVQAFYTGFYAWQQDIPLTCDNKGSSLVLQATLPVHLQSTLIG